MQMPPEIVLRGVETRPYIERIIAKGIAKLEQVCDHIVSVRIVVERAQHRHQTGDPYRMRIYMIIPDRREIVVERFSLGWAKRTGGLAETHTEAKIEGDPELWFDDVDIKPAPRRSMRQEPLSSLVRRTFDSARRELNDVVEKQRGEVKAPAQQEATAVVEKLFRDQDHGFLRTLDGEQVYFHRNSVLHNHWDKMTVGTEVRYAAEVGEKGLQASTVEQVAKRGVAEAHDDLHDLPTLAEPSGKARRRSQQSA